MKKGNAYAQALTRINFLSKKEIAELPNLLLADERILAVISGFYTAGTAILCVTSKRLLLVDKKIIRLSIEDIRFESIKEVNYSHQAAVASVRFYYAGRQIEFKSWYKNELRMLSQLVQQKMFEVREKLHYRNEAGFTRDEAQEIEVPKLQPQPYAANPQLEQYLSERIARWRKATRFVDMLATSQKTGKQVLDLESPKS